MFGGLFFWVVTLPGNSGLNEGLYIVTTLPNKCKNPGGDYYWGHYIFFSRGIRRFALSHALRAGLGHYITNPNNSLS